MTTQNVRYIESGFYIYQKFTDSSIIWSNHGKGNCWLGWYSFSKRGDDDFWVPIPEYIYKASPHPEMEGNLLLVEHLMDVIAGVAKPSKLTQAEKLINGGR